MTFLDAKTELNDLLELHKSLILLNDLRNNLYAQSLKSPQIKDCFSKSVSTSSDDKLIEKVLELSKLDEKIKSVSAKEKFYLERIQVIESKHSARLLAVYYMGYKLKQVAIACGYSRSEMSRKFTHAIRLYANSFDKPLKFN